MHIDHVSNSTDLIEEQNPSAARSSAPVPPSTAPQIDFRTFAELVGEPIVAMTPHVDGQSVVVASTHNLFEVDIFRQRVTLLRFQDRPNSECSKTFAELTEQSIVALISHTAGHLGFIVATTDDLFDVNMNTQLAPVLKFRAGESKV